MPGQWAGLLLPDETGGEIGLAMSSRASYLSGVYGAGNDVLGRFSLPRGRTDLRLRVPAGVRRVHVALDGTAEGGEVRLEDARLL